MTILPTIFVYFNNIYETITHTVKFSTKVACKWKMLLKIDISYG